MKPERWDTSFRSLIAILCTITLLTGNTLAFTPQQTSAPKPASQAAKIPPEQLDSLVAPIALYPDPLLAQVLAASTYPLEIVMLQRWLENKQESEGQRARRCGGETILGSQCQALAGLPEVVKRLGDDIQWTADLGNAFLAQQSDVMDAVQRMRKKAQEKGTLKSTSSRRWKPKSSKTRA